MREGTHRVNGIGRAMTATGVTLVGATVLTKALYTWPDLLPQPLRRFGNTIVDASGATSIESSSDVELAYLFALGALVTLVLLVVARSVGGRWLQKP